MSRSSRAMSLLSPPSSHHHQPPDDALLPDLKGFLDAEPRPTFIVAINPHTPTPFELLLCNHAFYAAGLAEGVLAKTRAATIFRSWCQVASHWRSEIEFAGRIWTAFKIQDRWKCIRASDASSVTELRPRTDLAIATDDVIRRLEDVKFADARLAGLYQMMEMSDVGTFEYSPEGILLRANESWYRLSQHPKQKTAHTNFSFMDLVYPADAPMVLSQWNKLAQGLSVTFEMRWKGRDYGRGTSDRNTEDCQWILSTCVPILDKNGDLVSIAGNTIDINAQKLVQEEALQRAEALERARQSERKFARFALLAPIAIVILDTQQRMTYCNMRFFELTGLPPADEYRKIDWQSICYPGDQDIVSRQWHKVLRDKQRTQAHFRLNRTWNFGDGAPRQAWAECQTIPELNDEGDVVSVFSVMTDISRFKWAEEVQRTRIEEALEAKRKHENFIDMTSHEMRNPLSAVIQCADSTIDSLRNVQSQISASTTADEELTRKADEEIKQCLDSLQTIISCSLHQKRVVDDILTLSKMDSNLMAITPVRVEPASVVAEAVHMFEVECQKDSIDLSLTEDPSLRELGAQYVMMDPSRALQVLINLVTNAIKFTRDRPVRRIEISLGASLDRPTQNSQEISWANVTTSAGDLLNNDEWGAGREVYVWIKCRDTGCGLSLEEQGSLFTRFSQATPRTHIRYGGSGLGLFISKKLTELQGGAIGVQSQPDVGSTFAFFVSTRTSPPPTPMKITSIKDDPWNWPVTMEDSGQDHSKYSVLIVEDNLVNQKVLSQQLQKAGCTVYVSNHGAEALEFLRTTEYWSSPSAFPPASSNPADGQNSGGCSNNGSNAGRSNETKHGSTSSGCSTNTTTTTTTTTTITRPSLATMRTGAAAVPRTPLSVILMDIEMPVMDGLACARQIRALQATGNIVGHVPIMAVSANARSEQVAQARDAGMDDAIAKPFRIPELMAKLETLIKGQGPTMLVSPSTGLA